MKSSKTSCVLIVADAHLPLDGRPGAEEQLRSFSEMLRHYDSKLQSLVLLGDLFDFWYEWKHVVPRRAFPLLHQLRSIVEAGTPVHYFAGNHDFLLGSFLRDEVGLSIHMDEWVTELDGRKYWFHHGDGLARSDVNYRRMKRVFRSRWAQRLFGGLVHPDLALGLGRTTSDSGRKKHDRRGGRIWPPESEYFDAAQRMIDRGYDVVVIGHTHIASDVELKNGFFHNPGAWGDDRSYSVIAGDLPKHEVWK